ncbi:hypothetical protein LHJ74_14695 [Streptomyces sp. N2-109]|uniref:Uncharacterized protein n=1 Tax=Streptomyces gossypii TaxID=2883101 RepID=A0ABT2JTD3_9ACTN|nr:hypothetical protein [Streptomyces gossypii]MCT2591140.1 hypothetical protein [Streptomyces gossypii]
MKTSVVTRLKAARTALLTVSGLGALTAAAWSTFGLGAGLASAGLSCFALEYLTGEDS